MRTFASKLFTSLKNINSTNKDIRDGAQNYLRDNIKNPNDNQSGGGVSSEVYNFIDTYFPHDDGYEGLHIELAKKFEGLDERIEEEKKKFTNSTKQSDIKDELNDNAYTNYNNNVNELLNNVYNNIEKISDDERKKIDLDYPNFPKEFIKQQLEYFKTDDESKGEINIEENYWENISLLDFGKDEFESDALDNVKDLSSLNTTTQLDSSEQTVYNSFYKQWCDLFLKYIYDKLKLKNKSFG